MKFFLIPVGIIVYIRPEILLWLVVKVKPHVSWSIRNQFASKTKK